MHVKHELPVVCVPVQCKPTGLAYSCDYKVICIISSVISLAEAWERRYSITSDHCHYNKPG